MDGIDCAEWSGQVPHRSWPFQHNVDYSPPTVMQVATTVAACLEKNYERCGEAAGLSQEKLAFAAGLDRTYISQLEHDKKSPALWTCCSDSATRRNHCCGSRRPRRRFAKDSPEAAIEDGVLTALAVFTLLPTRHACSLGPCPLMSRAAYQGLGRPSLTFEVVNQITRMCFRTNHSATRENRDRHGRSYPARRCEHDLGRPLSDPMVVAARLKIHVKGAAAAGSGEALLVLEPAGGGGDLRVTTDVTEVEQLKAKSDGGTWSLQTIIREVLPDLFLAVEDRGSARRFRFITEGRMGRWADGTAFFRRLESVDPPEDIVAALNDERPLVFQASPPTGAGATAFFAASTYTERSLFLLIASALRSSTAIEKLGLSDAELHRRLWRLLGASRVCR